MMRLGDLARPRGRRRSRRARAAAAAARRSRAACSPRSRPTRRERLAARLPRGCVLVSATNGKTTTCALLAEVLRGRARLARNSAGANLAVRHRLGARRALDGDRRARPVRVRRGRAARHRPQLEPRAIALGNLFRDQLDRYGELELVAARWRELVAAPRPGDDARRGRRRPAHRSLAEGHPTVVRYGIDDPSVALPVAPHAADARFCVRCGHPYDYVAAYVGHLSDYRCPSCGNARAPLDLPPARSSCAASTAPRSTSATATSACASSSPCPASTTSRTRSPPPRSPSSLGEPLDVIAERPRRASAARSAASSGCASATPTLVLLLIKNPAGANEVLRILPDGDASLLFALNDRIADGRDVSWIWDVDWELVAPRLRHVVASGTRAGDAALRAQVRRRRPGGDRGRARRRAARSTASPSSPAGGTGYVLPTYTAMLELQRVAASRGLARPYWEEAAA